MPRKGFSARRVSVARNDMRSHATRCQFEELVVLWISASLYLYLHIHPFRLRVRAARKDRTSSSSTYRRNRFRLKTSWSSAKAEKEIIYFSFSQSPVQCVARLRIGQEQSAD
jgi:hypothetical protein